MLIEGFEITMLASRKPLEGSGILPQATSISSFEGITDHARLESLQPEEETAWSNRPLYVSHFLSTWNMRGFEFGAVLFLATIFPGTLLPTSVYALVRAASAVILSPIVGRYIDTGNRLHVIRVSIGKSPSQTHTTVTRR